jgi:hypothetical protein
MSGTNFYVRKSITKSLNQQIFVVNNFDFYDIETVTLNKKIALTMV